MPNTNNPTGLRPVKHQGVSEYSGAINPYYVPASYAVALFIGDPVIKTGTGNAARIVAPGAGYFGIGTVAEVNRAVAGTTNRVTGVIVGFAPDPDGLGRIHNPASTQRIVYVCDDPNAVFEIQADGVVGALSVGLNAVLTYATAGSATSGFSGAQLDSGTTTAPATTAAFQMQILRAVNREDNEGENTNAKFIVKLINHTEVNASAGI